MKLGQVLSTIDFDLIPEGEREQFKEKLAELRDDAPRVPFAKQRKLMESELGGPLVRGLRRRSTRRRSRRPPSARSTAPGPTRATRSP